jgi:hypothetical protein
MMRRALGLLAFLPCLALAQTDKAAAEQSLKQIEAFTNMQAKNRPALSGRRGRLLIAEVDGIVKVAACANGCRRSGSATPLYRRPSTRRSATRCTPMSWPMRARAPGASWESRYAELEAQAKAGKLGARAHALHALEAAMALAPNDAELIAWRRAKVPLATAYEMGNLISRPEYEERWAKTTAYFLDRQRKRPIAPGPKRQPPWPPKSCASTYRRFRRARRRGPSSAAGRLKPMG